MKHIVSFSGGKDSTAMLLMMIEKGMQVDDIIFCDTGKEFPQMYEHIEKVEKYIKRKITVLKSDKSFDYLLTTEQRKTGREKGVFGLGWMSFNIRWCTGELKKEVIRKYLRKYKKEGFLEYLGIAFDEQKRLKNNAEKKNLIFPLNDWQITEKQALDYCYSKGFDWSGLYEKFVRVSCYLCPLQRLGELKIIYNEFPELWEDMRRLDKFSWRKFRSDYTLSELEQKFERENEQIKSI